MIQSTRGDEPTFLNAAWTLQSARGVRSWLVALLRTWPAAAVYHDATMRRVLPVLALTLLISEFNSTNLLTLSRHMGVRRLFLLDFSSQVVSLAVTVTWAWVSPTVWALVAGNLVSTVYRLGLARRGLGGCRQRSSLVRGVSIWRDARRGKALTPGPGDDGHLCGAAWL